MFTIAWEGYIYWAGRESPVQDREGGELNVKVA